MLQLTGKLLLLQVPEVELERSVAQLFAKQSAELYVMGDVNEEACNATAEEIQENNEKAITQF